MSSVTVIVTTLAALAGVEAMAWCWMNPPHPTTPEPVLQYHRPAPTANCPQPTANRPPPSANRPPTTTPLPELYRQSAPMLRCSTGEVCRVDTDDHLTLHLAFFEWNDTDTGSVLEAFRHMPEACMGSIGMKLLSKEKPIPYTIAGPLAANSGDCQKNEQAPGQDETSLRNPSSTANRQPPTANRPQPTANPSLSPTLLFDHTVFQDPGDTSTPTALNPRVHAYRAIWVSGTAQADARQGMDGQQIERLRSIRLKSALTRYRPRHARVIQGAVRGALTPEAAWQAFEQTMLVNLKME